MRFFIAKTFTLALILVWCVAALAVPSDIHNPQGMLWNLLESGRIEEAHSLERGLQEVLTQTPITKISPLGGGVSGAWLVYFPNNIVAVLKGEDPVVVKAQQNEVAAYVVDRALNINMVPLTVLRNIEGKTYSLQLYYPALPKKTDDKEVSLELKTARASDLGLFDYIIHNFDRIISEEHNIVNGRDGRLIGIDHARSFYLDEEYSQDLKDELIEGVSANFKKNLAELRVIELLRKLSAFLSQNQLKELKGRLNFVKMNLAEVSGEPLNHRAPFAQIPKEFRLPQELQVFFKINTTAIQNILGRESLENPIEAFKRLTLDSFKPKDRSFNRIVRDWKTYAWDEKFMFIKTLVEVRGRLNNRYAIPRLAEEIFKVFPEELPILELAMPDNLLKRDYVYMINRIGSQQKISKEGLAQLKKALWSEVGPQFIETYFVGEIKKVYHPEYEVLLRDRIVFGISNGEFADGQAFSLIQYKGVNGLPELLKIPNRKIRNEILGAIKIQLASTESMIQQKQWTTEYKDKVSLDYNEVLEIIDSALDVYRCESLF